MSAVTKTEAQSPAVADYSASLLEVISKAARDPNVDIDKMERLLQMQERVSARDAEVAFNQALNAAQSEMGTVGANASNPQTRSRYATFDKLDRVLRPIYTHHGFSLSFDEGDSPKPEHVRVLCYVSHTGGHTRTYHRDMPADGKGAKGGDVMTKTHAAGAAGSYGARYLLKGIFNVAVGEDDDDGNAAVGAINDDELARLQQLVEVTNSNIPKLLAACGLPNQPLRNLTLAGYERCKDALETKLARMAKEKANV
jgi:ERF superfamily